MTGQAPDGGRPHPEGSPDGRGPHRPPPQHVVKRTRAGGVWFAAVSFAVILVLLLIFILQNSQKVQISYFGAHGQLPLGVALLFAAVLGILLVVIPGTARIVQLRITARRHRAADAERADGTQAPPAGTAPAAGEPGRR
jgi:lipopolysaccharide assembly protein A